MRSILFGRRVLATRPIYTARQLHASPFFYSAQTSNAPASDVAHAPASLSSSSVGSVPSASDVPMPSSVGSPPAPTPSPTSIEAPEPSSSSKGTSSSVPALEAGSGPSSAQPSSSNADKSAAPAAATLPAADAPAAGPTFVVDTALSPAGIQDSPSSSSSTAAADFFIPPVRKPRAPSALKSEAPESAPQASTSSGSALTSSAPDATPAKQPPSSGAAAPEQDGSAFIPPVKTKKKNAKKASTSSTGDTGVSPPSEAATKAKGGLKATKLGSTKEERAPQVSLAVPAKPARSLVKPPPPSPSPAVEERVSEGAKVWVTGFPPGTDVDDIRLELERTCGPVTQTQMRRKTQVGDICEVTFHRSKDARRACEGRISLGSDRLLVTAPNARDLIIGGIPPKIQQRDLEAVCRAFEPKHTKFTPDFGRKGCNRMHLRFAGHAQFLAALKKGSVTVSGEIFPLSHRSDAFTLKAARESTPVQHLSEPVEHKRASPPPEPPRLPGFAPTAPPRSLPPSSGTPSPADQKLSSIVQTAKAVDVGAAAPAPTLEVLQTATPEVALPAPRRPVHFLRSSSPGAHLSRYQPSAYPPATSVLTSASFRRSVALFQPLFTPNKWSERSFADDGGQKVYLTREILAQEFVEGIFAPEQFERLGGWGEVVMGTLFLRWADAIQGLHKHHAEIRSNRDLIRIRIISHETYYPPTPFGSIPDPARPPVAPQGLTTRDLHLALALEKLVDDVKGMLAQEASV